MLLLSLLIHHVRSDGRCPSWPARADLKVGNRKAAQEGLRGLEAYASEIAEAVLTHPLIQPVGHRRATSIRKEELIRLLYDLANKGFETSSMQRPRMY